MGSSPTGKFLHSSAITNSLLNQQYSGRNFINNVVEAPPYKGAKPSFLIEEKIEDREWLSELVRISVKELPEPKPKKKKTK